MVVFASCCTKQRKFQEMKQPKINNERIKLEYCQSRGRFGPKRRSRSLCVQKWNCCDTCMHMLQQRKHKHNKDFATTFSIRKHFVVTKINLNAHICIYLCLCMYTKIFTCEKCVVNVGNTTEQICLFIVNHIIVYVKCKQVRPLHIDERYFGRAKDKKLYT